MGDGGWGMGDGGWGMGPRGRGGVGKVPPRPAHLPVGATGGRPLPDRPAQGTCRDTACRVRVPGPVARDLVVAGLPRAARAEIEGGAA